ncbi:class I adenylate-forming enzyme family protein [Streptomyces sp. NPDC088729]|uniref:class I adenylate-forming enzyme family protein n=1 Tax=Streptomyces sp. NPDC088729 TaxID=3365876 RepID=UPI0037F5C3C7
MPPPAGSPGPPRNRATVLDHLARNARALGPAPYLTAVDPDGGEDTLTFADAELLSRRLAGRLREEVGAAAGVVVGLAPANDVSSVLAVLALLRTGAAVLLLGPHDPPERVRAQTARLGVRTVLRSPALPVRAQAPGPPRQLTLPGVRRACDPRADGRPAVDRAVALPDDALVFATSGSTAASKLVVQSHLNLVSNAEMLTRHHGLRPGDRLLGCLPIHHVNGLHFTVLAPLVAGAHVVLAHGFDPLTHPRLIVRHRPRIASVVPSVLDALLETWRRPGQQDHLGCFVTAAAPLTSGTARSVAQRLRVPVVQGYGLTETTNFATTMPHGLTEDLYRRLVLDEGIPSVGVPLPGTGLAVLREDGTPAAPGEAGEVCMRGPHVMSRYEGNPEATGRALRGGWFHSEDLGRTWRDPASGRVFLTLTGRIKNIAKVGGEAVSLDEMDRVLRAVPEVRDAACAALPHRLLGEQVVAAVVLAPGAATAGLRERLAAVFPAAVLPHRIVALDAIPRTATGKVLRPDLARRLAADEHPVARPR